MSDVQASTKKENWIFRVGKWLWAKIVTLAVIVWGLILKAVAFFEDILTDINKKADVRVWLGIVGTLVIYKLALEVPKIILAGRVFDLVAYGVVISILSGFVLALFGIAKSSLEASGDKSGPGEGIVSEIGGAITDAVGKITG